MKVTNEVLLQKIDLVVHKLMNLGGANYDQDKVASKESTKAGNIARDFGIEEWDWPQGVGLYGLQKLESYWRDDRSDEFLDNWYQNNIKIGLPSKNVNTTAPFLTLANMLDRLNRPEYEKMCLERAEWLMNGLPKTKENGFQHVTSAIGDRNGVILNEGQLWADTLFMTVLFLNKMGHKYHRQDWIDESIHQFLIHIKYLYDKQTGFFYHGWSFERNDNFGGIFWCRGNSWFTFGVIDFLEMFDGDLDKGTEAFLIDTFKAQVDALCRVQLDSGLWPTVLTDPDSYGEVSGTAAIATGILKGIRLGILDDSYQVYADKAIAAICENVAEDGTVLNVSAGTGMGMDAEHYRNIIIAPMAYGQSLALVALCTALDQ